MTLYDNYDGYIFDLDGVLWRGDRVIEGAPEALKQLRDGGKKIMFATNNSSRSHLDMVSKLTGMGFEVFPEEIFSAPRVTAQYLATRFPNATCYVIGNPGLFRELRDAGVNALPARSKDFRKVDFVIVGNDREISYDKLTCALWAIEGGAKFFAVNRDALNPVYNGILPGAGAVVAAVEAIVRHPPDFMVGKPSPLLLEMGLEWSGIKPDRCLMVGDTLDTDIAAAKNAGVHSALVLSGNSKLEDITDELRPTHVIPDVRALLQYN